MSRTGRFLRGVGLSYVNQVVITAVGLWLTPFLLGHLGATEYGLWLVGTQLLAYLLLLDVGVIALVPRDVAYASGLAEDGEKRSVQPVVARAARMLLWQLPVIALAAYLLWFFLPASWAGLRGPLGAAFAGFVVLYPLRLANAALEGLQDLAYLGSAFLVAWATGIVATVAFVLADLGLWAVALGWIVNQAVIGLAWVWRLWRRHRSALPRSLRVPAGDTAAYLKRSVWMSVSQISNVLLHGTDLLIIGRLIGPEAVVPYSLTAKLMTVLQHQPHVLMHAALPGISELRARGDRAALLRVVMGLMLGMLLVSGGVAVGIMAVNRSFVAWWVGAHQYGGDRLTAVLLLLMLARHVGLVMAQANFGLGDERRGGIISIIEGVASVTAAFALVRVMGPIGAPLGALAAAVLIRIPMHLSELARRTGESRATLLNALTPLGWRIALMFALAILVAPLLPEAAPGANRNPMVLLAIGAAGGLVGLVYVAATHRLLRGSPLEPYVDRIVAGAQARLRRRAQSPTAP